MACMCWTGTLTWLILLKKQTCISRKTLTIMGGVGFYQSMTCIFSITSKRKRFSRKVTHFTEKRTPRGRCLARVNGFISFCFFMFFSVWFLQVTTVGGSLVRWVWEGGESLVVTLVRYCDDTSGTFKQNWWMLQQLSPNTCPRMYAQGVTNLHKHKFFHLGKMLGILVNQQTCNENMIKRNKISLNILLFHI